MLVRPFHLFSTLIFAFILLGFAQSISAQEVVLYAGQAPVKVGNWTVVGDSTAAGSVRLYNPDQGAAKVATPAAAPSSYVEMSFFATANIPYHLWIRGKADGDSPYNDSVHVQFSGSMTNTGAAVYRIGTSSSTEINLEDCLGCGISGWGWQDNGWGSLGSNIYFQTSGTQTIRIQPREDGISIDQIVLSPNLYLSRAPGAMKNDSIILSPTGGAAPPSSTPTPTPTPTPAPTPSSASEIVIWANNVSSVFGSWRKESNSTAAGQVALHQPDAGAVKLTTASASPSNYFEVSFPAVAGTGYRLWIRGRADGDSPYNDSVFVQFSGSVNSSGSAVYRSGTTSALEMNLEDCSGCGISGWGWQDDGWGIGILGPLVYFQSSGTQTIRIQTREDGLSIDQVVLSPSRYLLSGPGALMNDGVILASTLGSVAPPPPPPNQPPSLSISASPTSGVSPLFVSFASSASDADGFIASYFWNFGDGTSSSSANPTHTYSAGSYNASLTVTDNSGATTTKSVGINASAQVTSSTTIKVLSWNMQFGEGTDGVTDWNRIANYIANFNPDLVSLCEMPPDSISTLVSFLNSKTGRTWFNYFVPKAPGIPEGNLILSKYSFSSTSSKYLTNERSVAQATVNIGGKTVNFFATHLDAYDSTIRYSQVTQLQSFMSGFSETRIAGGDFNAGPDLSETVHMGEQYYDSWNSALNAGTASAYPDNPVQWMTRTRRGRIDYLWLSKNANVNIKSTQIPDVRDLNNTNVVVFLGTADDKGVRPSDHNPMIAILELR